MAVAQIDLDTINTNIDTLKTNVQALLAGMAAGEQLDWAPDADVETDIVIGRTIKLAPSGTTDPTAAGDDARAIANMEAILNFGSFSSPDAS